MDSPGSGYRESPVVFSAGRADLFGIFSQPRTSAGDLGVVLLTGGGFIPMMHRNRMWVRLARRLAAAGWPVLRFDYHGVGESSGRVDEFWLDRPFVEDLDAAVSWLRGKAVSRIALVGSCFGARTILAGSESLGDLAGICLLSVPLRGHRQGELAANRFAEEWTAAQYMRRAFRWRVLQRLLTPEWQQTYVRILKVKLRDVLNGRQSAQPGERSLRWISRGFLQPLRRLVERGVPVLLLYGSAEEYYNDFRRAAQGELGDLLAAGRLTLEVRTIGGVLHGFTTLAAQSQAIECAFDWITGLRRPTTDAAPAAVGESR